MYEKLFDINYNNKRFSIFSDKNNQKTFLELDKNNNYLYPTLNDFLTLDNIYNQKKSVVCYEVDKKIKNKIRIYLAGTLIVLNVFCAKNGVYAKLFNFKLQPIKETPKTTQVTNIPVLHEEETKFEVVKTMEVNKEKPLKYSQDFTNLDNKLSSVTREDVIKAINSNYRIPVFYKYHAIKLLDFMTFKYPDTDYRIFYENIKTLKIKRVLDNNYKEKVLGCYIPKSNTIELTESNKRNVELINHELLHAYYCWYDKEEDIYYMDNNGRSLDEAMISKLTNNICHSDSFRVFEDVLDYFMTCVPYSIKDYETGRIACLIDMLKEKYPKVDIDYIINSLDTMKDTYINLGDEITLSDNKNLVDKLFEICLENIDLNAGYTDIYTSFLNFYRVIESKLSVNSINKYLNKYNKFLLEKGYNNGSFTIDVKNEEYNNNIFNKLNLIIQEEKNVNNALKNFAKDSQEINFAEIIDGDIYDYFFEYFSEYLNKEQQDGVYQMLDVYNDFLYLNGVKEENIITVEMLKEKVNKFLSIYGIIGVEGTIYPILEKKVELNQDGMEMEKYLLEGKDDKYYLTEKENKSILFKDENSRDLYDMNVLEIFSSMRDGSYFTEKFFEKAYDISEYYYKFCRIYNDGIFIKEDLLSNLKISFGLKSNGEIGYKIVDINNEVVYSDLLVDVSKEMYTFSSYLSDLEFNETIELNDFLNYNYLKEFVKSTDIIMPNITYDEKNDSLNYHRTYYLERLSGDKISRSELNYCFLEEGILFIPNGEEDIIYEFNEIYNTTIYLETILEYYGILSNDKSVYSFSDDEIINLFTKYIKEVYKSNKTLVKRK